MVSEGKKHLNTNKKLEFRMIYLLLYIFTIRLPVLFLSSQASQMPEGKSKPYNDVDKRKFKSDTNNHADLGDCRYCLCTLYSQSSDGMKISDLEDQIDRLQHYTSVCIMRNDSLAILLQEIRISHTQHLPFWIKNRSIISGTEA
jgi:hypothetical protein